MRASSQDLRSRILSAVDQGKSRVEIVATFQVSQATITRYRKLLRETGTLATKPIPGRSPKKRVALQAGLSTQLATHPDATLDEHCRMWEAEHGMKVSSATMSRAIKCLHWTRKKKTLSVSEQNNEARAAWRESVSDLKSNQLVFIDACGSNIGLTRLMARAPSGQRAHGKVPRNRGKNTTLIASLSLRGIGEALILEGAIQTAIFELYMERILGPSLEPGQIVVMDNLRVHKGERVRQIIEARGCHVLFLPAYSSDFSPIEEAFSKLKAFLRKVGARTREDLQEMLIQALGTITTQDAQGWFRHCGYRPLEVG